MGFFFNSPPRRKQCALRLKPPSQVNISSKVYLCLTIRMMTKYTKPQQNFVYNLKLALTCRWCCFTCPHWFERQFIHIKQQLGSKFLKYLFSLSRQQIMRGRKNLIKRLGCYTIPKNANKRFRNSEKKLFYFCRSSAFFWFQISESFVTATCGW